LDALDGVATCNVEGSWIVVGSTRENCNYILRGLIEREIRVLELREDTPDLEDMFINSTAGKVT